MIGISTADVTNIDIKSPTNLSYYTGRNMVVVYNVTGNGSSYNCTIDFNFTNYYSGNGISNNTATTVTLSSVTAELKNGSLSINCTDQHETLIAGYNITTDFTPPNAFNLSVNATNNRVNHVNASINITIEYIETYFDYITISANYTYGVNNFTSAGGNSSWTTNWSILGCSASASSCVVRTEAVDSAGNNNWDSITLYLDTTELTISAMNWSDTDYISNSTNNYVVNVSYTASWIENVTIMNWTGGKGKVMSCSSGYCTLTINMSYLGYDAEGSFGINATVYDVFGISANTSINVTVDNTAPAINDTLTSNCTDNFSEYGDSVFFYYLRINESNTLMCYLEDNSMTNETVIGDIQEWNYTSTNIKDCSGNCTYCRVEGYCIDMADNRVDFDINITILPCLDTTDATIDSTSATKNSLSITLNNSAITTTNIWMVPQSYNDTFGQCNYNVSNTQNFTVYNATINLTYTTTYARCNISIVRDTTDTGAIEVSVHTGLSQTQPSSIPAAAIGTLALILIFAHIIATKTST